MRARVLKSTGSWYGVQLPGGWHVSARLRGRFRSWDIQHTNPIAVGDWVEVAFSEEDDTMLITSLEPRENYIVRRSVKRSKQVHILAANLDQALLLVTPRRPLTHPEFIDRFLVTAKAYGIPAALLFNKIDLCADDSAYAADLKALKGVYEGIYRCVEVSVQRGIGLNAVRELLRDKVSLVAGHSGVGKSSLINALEPGLGLRIQALSEQHQQGQHTTTFSEMHPLHFGAYVVDTPGIKGFGLVDVNREETADYFPEFFARKGACKFYNCLHLEEPGCAVREALDRAEIAPSRYRSYLSLIREEEDGGNRKTKRAD